VNLWYTAWYAPDPHCQLKLQTTPEQFRALRHTQLAYRDALNSVSRYAFAHGKMIDTPPHTWGRFSGYA